MWCPGLEYLYWHLHQTLTCPAKSSSIISSPGPLCPSHLPGLWVVSVNQGSVSLAIYAYHSIYCTALIIISNCHVSQHRGCHSHYGVFSTFLTWCETPLFRSWALIIIEQLLECGREWAKERKEKKKEALQLPVCDISFRLNSGSPCSPPISFLIS